MANREDWYLKNRGECIFTGYEKDVLFSQGEEFFEGKLSQYPNAYDITVYRNYEVKSVKRVLFTRAIIQSLAGYKNINNSRKILARKSFGLRIGDLINFNNDMWLTTDWVNKQRTTDDFSSLTLCNHKLSFKKIEKEDTGVVDDLGRTIYDETVINYELPCCYVTDVINSYDDTFINLPDNRARAYIQFTDLISVNDEVNVAGKNYRVYGIDKNYMITNNEINNEDDDFISEYGVLILTLEAPMTTT